MIYVALLRGINVGGNNKIQMPLLREVFESIGLSNVTSYINSGNVIFESDKSPSQIVANVEKVILQRFGINVPVVVRRQDELSLLCEQIPSSWTNDKDQKTDVMFLWDEISSSDLVKIVVHKPEIENLLQLEGALIWNVSREHVTKGSGIKLIKTSIYKKMTVRNINTVRKLNEIMLSLI